MEMRDRGDVPGITGEGACKEATCSIDKMGDDHFDDLQGKFGGGDERAMGSCSETPEEKSCPILARLRNQTHITNSSIAVGVNSGT